MSLCAFSLKLSDRSRILAFCAGFAGTLGWFALLRRALPLFWRTPAIPWAFCAATVVVTLVCERLLRPHEGMPALEPAVTARALSSTT
jgi:hypothetical protein